ncbi:glycoside hydrolase family 3 C-terminal domain-containing protein [Georgenia sp. TF02-10]|uniref:glycoside hydrolase family 3 C-terminal domain-containing protein n=1 Tax=Georgenia sp. TF02-10 TaxID=2917725 RepID=UPI001FA6CA60|nr:glycoside hydrolase family 3 C-terminal domain-containing protein [Georgenia sp. TF02-10]UNX55794.1 glycoside hydrolase family 3 C-terminal domain-containing protein [Georgenia sp. TF02-10]
MSPSDVDRLIDELTIEEKAALLSGSAPWESTPVERLGITSIWFADGPHGIRRETAPLVSLPATCFPTQSCLGATWDRDLVHRVGAALGREASAQDVAVLLGPGLTMKRTPLNGRNFENFSEDPRLTGELAVAYIRGVQSQGVGASLKPFALNNQETFRHWVSVEVDERTFREIYGAVTERVVRDAEPWTIMNSYNRVNGVFAAQDAWLLTTVLREEYGYAGTVISDWGAVHDRVAAVAAGTDLEMDFTPGREVSALAHAVRSGRLEQSVLDRSVRRVLELLARAASTERGIPLSREEIDAHHALAREAAAAGTVVLRNDGVLPLSPGSGTVAVVGRYAAEPRMQGGGSALVNPTRVETALEAFQAVAGSVAYAPGFSLTDSARDEALESEAAAAAAEADVAVVFLGQTDGTESEGYDRATIDVPDNQLRVLDAVTLTGTPTVVVLVNGSVLRVEPWHESVNGLVHGWFSGQAGGPGVVDVLFGAVNPSGRLSETMPVRLEDSPGFATFPGERGEVRYGEGVFIGYRWYDALDLTVSYPFGHGFSYTTFEYSDLAVEVIDTTTGAVTVAFTVTNTGRRAGAEVAQLYVGDTEATVRRPVRELRGFAKVYLEPGESSRVVLDLNNRDFAWYDVVDALWRRDGGTFVIEVGASSRDVRLSASIELPDDPRIPALTEDTDLGLALQGRHKFDPYDQDEAGRSDARHHAQPGTVDAVPWRALGGFRGQGSAAFG